MEIIGHQKIANILKREIATGSFAQAYIFSGPKSVGKTTLAGEFGAGLVWGKDFSTLSSKERQDAELDLVWVWPVVEEKKGVTKSKEISIEQVLEAKKEMANFPYQGKAKVLIVEEADRLTQKAQNALLKITEEPNSSSVIILVSSRLAKILPTIQSRCRTVNFGLVDRSDMEKYFEAQGLPSNQEFVAFSMGRPGILLGLLKDAEKVEWFRSAKERMAKALRGGLNEKLKVADELAKNVPEALQNLEFWLWESRSGQLDLGKAEKINGAIEKIKNTNVNARLILENLFINI